MRRNIEGAIVRVKITLPGELNVHLREGEVREVLKGAHYLAALVREVEGERRTRISAGTAEGLSPMGATFIGSTVISVVLSKLSRLFPN